MKTLFGAALVAALFVGASSGRAVSPQLTSVTIPSEAAFLADNRAKPGVVETPSGLQYQVLQAGAGPHPTDADVVLVNYEGKLLDGVTFDHSTQPTPMPVAGVVPGFGEALKLMNKGARLRAWIPSRLAYGSQGSGPIPPHYMLIFDVELIEFLPQTVIDKYRQKMEAGKAKVRARTRPRR